MVLSPPQEQAILVVSEDIAIETIPNIQQKNIWLAADLDANSTVDLLITKYCCDERTSCEEKSCYQAFAMKNGI